jgi:hypothetical protein
VRDVGNGPSGTGLEAIDDQARMISNRNVEYDERGRVGVAGSPHRTSSFFPSPEPHAMDLPPLEGDLHDRLREDIRLRGIQVPILVDNATGEVIDGRLRRQIAAEL